MTTNQSIQIGFIGAGANTRLRHLPGFLANHHAECSIICNRSEASSSQVAQEFNIPRFTTDWRSVVGDPSVHAVCIGTWPDTHAEFTIAALEAGKHVLVEARMARSLDEARAMQMAAAEHPNLITQIVPSPLSLDHDATIRRHLSELGTLREIQITSHSSQHTLPDSPITWRQRTEISGVNTLNLGILYETVQRWLGDMNPKWVAAHSRTFTKWRPDASGKPSEVSIPDSVSLTAGYDCGLFLSAELSSVTSGPSVLEIRIHGSAGSLRMDLQNQQLFRSTAGSSAETPVSLDQGTNRGWRVEEDFINSIVKSDPVNLTSFADGVRYMQFTDAAHRSWSNHGSKTHLS